MEIRHAARYRCESSRYRAALCFARSLRPFLGALAWIGALTVVRYGVSDLPTGDTLTSTDAPHATISAEEIATLNAARLTLQEIAKRALYGTAGLSSNQADGMVYAAADSAESAVFKVLNWADSWWHLSLTHAQLHMREEDSE